MITRRDMRIPGFEPFQICGQRDGIHVQDLWMGPSDDVPGPVFEKEIPGLWRVSQQRNGGCWLLLLLLSLSSAFVGVVLVVVVLFVGRCRHSWSSSCSLSSSACSLFSCSSSC